MQQTFCSGAEYTACTQLWVHLHGCSVCNFGWHNPRRNDNFELPWNSHTKVCVGQVGFNSMIGEIQKWWKSSPTSLLVTGNALEKYVRNYLKELPQQTSVLDVGGGDGRLIRQILKALPKGQHHVMEPVPDLYLKLRSQLGQADNLTLHNKGAAPFTDDVSYVNFLRGFSSDPEPVRLLNGKAELLNVLIPCQAIDSLFANDHFQLVIFRQGGSLLKAMESGLQLIQRDRPDLIFGSSGSRVYDIDYPEPMFKLLEERGYRIQSSEAEGTLSRQDFSDQWRSKKVVTFVAKAA